MFTLHQAQTCPVNPPNASPALSVEELWSVLQLKCQKPEIFVPVMSSSEVLEETPTSIKRKVMFKEGMGPPGGEVLEDIVLTAPWKADFYNRTSGAKVQNITSQGKDETDLYLTFYFDWPYPNMEAGSAEAKKTSEQLWDGARKAVQHAIDVAREMKRDGKLPRYD